MKTLREISYFISCGAIINMVVSMFVAAMFKMFVDFGAASTELNTAGVVIVLYGLWILVVATVVSNRIDKIADERSDAIRRRKRLKQI